MTDTLDVFLNEIIYKVNTVCDEVKELRRNTVSKEDYETLQKQIEIVSLEVAKTITTNKSELLYIPQQ